MAPHFVLFPFMAKGHTVPLLHLAQLLLNRRIAVTIFTTSGNRPFISQHLSGDNLSIVDLPFPDNIDGIPKGADSVHKLPSMSLFVSFVNGLKLMQPFFEEALQTIHSNVSCIVSDNFLPWSVESASRFGIPRLCFNAMSYYVHVVSDEAILSGSLSLNESDDEPFSLTRFPWISLCRNDFDYPLNKRDPRGPYLDLIMETIAATESSYGLLMNSFHELEPMYADFCEREHRPKAWSIGPLCLTKLQKNSNLSSSDKPKWMHWLDQKSDQGSPVLYVAFGSQSKNSPAQLLEIARGLEEARVSFLWVLKKSEAELLSSRLEGYEERVRERGMIVREWVDQEEILEHPIVQGFMTQCGWNSVLEGICAQVPILAWPIMADQYMSAKMLAEEIKVGMRVSTVDGRVKGFVTSDSLRCAVIELMEGRKGEELRAKVREVSEAARRAVAEGGSSWLALESLINEMKLVDGMK